MISRYRAPSHAANAKPLTLDAMRDCRSRTPSTKSGVQETRGPGLILLGLQLPPLFYQRSRRGLLENKIESTTKITHLRPFSFLNLVIFPHLWSKCCHNNGAFCILSIPAQKLLVSSFFPSLICLRFEMTQSPFHPTSVCLDSTQISSQRRAHWIWLFALVIAPSLPRCRAGTALILHGFTSAYGSFLF